MSYAVYVFRTMADKTYFCARNWQGLDADEAREKFERYSSEERELIWTVARGSTVAAATIELLDYGPNALPHAIGGRVIRKVPV